MCTNCLYDIIKKLRGTDIVILNSLKDTAPQTGLVIADLIDELNEKRTKIYNALERLILIGAVEYILEDRFHKFFITDIGLEILEILNNE